MYVSLLKLISQSRCTYLYFVHIPHTIGMSSHLYRMLVLFHFIVGVAIYYFRQLNVDRSSEKRGPRMYPCLCVRHRTVIPKKLVQFLLTNVPIESHYFTGIFMLRTNLPTSQFAHDYSDAILRCLRPRSFTKDLNL